MGLGDLLRFAGQYAAPGYARGKVQGQAQDRQDELDRQRRALELYAQQEQAKRQQAADTRAQDAADLNTMVQGERLKQARTQGVLSRNRAVQQQAAQAQAYDPNSDPQVQRELALRDRGLGRYEPSPPPTPEKPKIAIPYTGYTQRTNPLGQTERTPESLEDYVRRLHQAGIAPEVIADWISQQGLVPK